MTTEDINLDVYEKKMTSALEVLHKEFSGLRTGRASTSLLEPLMVDAYGAKMPITQVSTLSCPEPRMISIQVWDQGLTKAVEKAIRESSLGLNPMSEGSVIRVMLPDLTQERRKELAKVAGKYAEQGRIAIRNIRREGMDLVKKQEKDKHISEDDLRRLSSDLQKITDTYIAKIDKDLEQKEADIMSV